MKQMLKENQGIPASLLLTMAVVSGLTVANLYYNQPLLEEMRADFAAGEVEANLITVITQVGYACGLLFIVPMADMFARRKIVGVSMTLAAVMAALIAVAPALGVVQVTSLVLGVCSVIPQVFIPVAGQFSKPADKSRNIGIVLSGLLTGILGARVVSGYVGEWIGWRGMYGLAAVLMAVCLVLSLRVLPPMPVTFHGSYGGLMKSVCRLFVTRPRMRLYAVRAAFAFGSMLSVWSCLAFHLAGEPFHAGSDKVGLLGLCGVMGALVASGTGKFVPVLGIRRMSLYGSVLQLLSWLIAYVWGDTYVGLVLAILLLDIGMQLLQLSNQSGCLQEVPHASSRANTIFMTLYFIGGSVGTFCSGLGWEHFGWAGVCSVGAGFALVSMLVSCADRQ